MANDTITINKDSRHDAIAAAVKDTPLDIVETTVEETKEEPTKEEAKVEPTTEKKESSKEEKEPSAEDEETRQGRELIRALKNPATSSGVIKFLYEQSGLGKISAVETPKDVKEAKGDILKFLEDSLGDEFSFLASKLAPGLEKVLEKEAEKNRESQADIRRKFEEAELTQRQEVATRSLMKAGEEFFGKDELIPDNVIDEMSKLMDKLTPGEAMDPGEYTNLLFTTAVGKLGLSKPASKQKQSRTETNRNDASSRLASERGPANGIIKQANPKPVSREEAIKAAIEAVGNSKD